MSPKVWNIHSKRTESVTNVSIYCESATDKQFMLGQKSAYDYFANSYYSYSAHTYMGKSFIIRIFMKNLSDI